jgi:hypothetical protein
MSLWFCKSFNATKQAEFSRSEENTLKPSVNTGKFRFNKVSLKLAGGG